METQQPVDLVLYESSGFPPADHVVGRTEDCARYIEYLEERRVLPLLGPPGCGLKSLAASIGDAYRQRGYACFWFTFRDAYRDQVDDLLWDGSLFLAGQGATAYQHFLQDDRRAAHPYSLSVKVTQFLREFRSGKTLIVLANTQVVSHNPLFQAALAEMKAHFCYSGATSARLLLTGNGLPLEVEDHGLADVQGLSLPASQTLLSRMGVAISNGDLENVHTYTLGYPAFLQIYGWMATQYRRSGLGLPTLTDLAEDLWLHRYLYARYRLEKQEAATLHLLGALSALDTPIDHRVLRQQIAAESVPGYHVARLVANRLILTDAIGRAIFLHPLVRDVIKTFYQEHYPLQWKLLQERVKTYHEIQISQLQNDKLGA